MGFAPGETPSEARREAAELKARVNHYASGDWCRTLFPGIGISVSVDAISPSINAIRVRRDGEEPAAETYKSFVLHGSDCHHWRRYSPRSPEDPYRAEPISIDQIGVLRELLSARSEKREARVHRDQVDLLFM